MLILDIEKPAAGGRMLARHEGRVVLVAGAIPGERVAARVERVEKSVMFAETVDVLSASPDRRPPLGDPRCGGNLFAHIAYPRQLTIKGEIIRDGLARIGRMPLPDTPPVVGSPEQGYRMRARLHAREGALGFFLEGTHSVCDASATGQLLPATARWIDEARTLCSSRRLSGLAAVEVTENIDGSQRACHLELRAGSDAQSFAPLGAGLTGLSAQPSDRPEILVLGGTPVVCDTISLGSDQAGRLRLERDVRSFFQGNRFLVETLVRHVAGLVGDGPVIDLYAGVGLFGLSLAAGGRDRVVAVEGDPVASADLARNAAAFSGRVTVVRRSVEHFLESVDRRVAGVTVIVDPPRTGLSKNAIAGVIALKPRQIVYVSCDVATLARDTRLLLDTGYRIDGLSGLDLFPNTAHVETVANFVL